MVYEQKCFFTTILCEVQQFLQEKQKVKKVSICLPKFNCQHRKDEALIWFLLSLSCFLSAFLSVCVSSNYLSLTFCLSPLYLNLSSDVDGNV